jgi:hypothetical protein
LLERDHPGDGPWQLRPVTQGPPAQDERHERQDRAGEGDDVEDQDSDSNEHHAREEPRP